MDAAIERLVDDLLYEGYALYPYTPQAAKNATPTPFGIVYPSRYAGECAGAHDHARMRCLAVAGADATFTATVRWLAPTGDGHAATEQRAQLGPTAAGDPLSTDIPGGRLTLHAEPVGADGRSHVTAAVHNTADVPAGLDRGGALAHSLLSVHLVVEAERARFVSPLEAGLASVNIWPVLAGPGDAAVLGAGIVLPDHPQMAPASHGTLFDNTEIEEALVLHVHALTDAEREAALAGDRAVGDMLQRALALGPQEIMALHSGLTDSDALSPLPDPDAEIRGERTITVDGVTHRLGDTVVLSPGIDRDPYDRMLDGRRATIERIYIDSDDRVQLAVTVDDVAGQDLMRATGRYLFFFAHEVTTA